MLCAIYKSAKKDQTYLFVKTRDDFSAVPEPLMLTFGTPTLVTLTNLATKDKLAFADIEKVKSKEKTIKSKVKVIPEKIKLSKEDWKTINKAFDISTNEDDVAFISTLGLNIRKIDPSFDPRSYGFKTLTKLFQNIDKFEVFKKEIGGSNQPLLRIK